MPRDTMPRPTSSNLVNSSTSPSAENRVRRCSSGSNTDTESPRTVTRETLRTSPGPVPSADKTRSTVPSVEYSMTRLDKPSATTSRPSSRTAASATAPIRPLGSDTSAPTSRTDSPRPVMGIVSNARTLKLTTAMPALSRSADSTAPGRDGWSVEQPQAVTAPRSARLPPTS